MTNKDIHIAVLIVAGGSGTRMEQKIPKQYLTLRGQSILAHTIDVFRNMKEIDIIHTVIASGHEKFYYDSLEVSPLMPTYSIGGQTRQESVYKGLMGLQHKKPDIVLIHDAARPCVTQNDIRSLIAAIRQDGAATLAMPVTESLQRNGEAVNRDDLWVLQTPQGFYYSDILEAHKALQGKSYTDDTTLHMAHTGKKINYVSCGRHNLKVTTKDDLTMASTLLKENTETIVGQGFDVHAFSQKNAESIRICGIDILHNRSLEGHSDADIGLHVLTDAILSAISENDIGHHFPSSDETIKDMDSHRFLDKAMELLTKHRGELRHIDLTFMCEQPNIGKHREVMRQHLSEYLEIPLRRISIKGTTTQKLGFTGRGEGIAAQAIVTIKVPTYD